MTEKYPRVRFNGRPTNTSGYGRATSSFCAAFSESNIDTNFESLKSIPKNLNLSSYSGLPDIDFSIRMPRFKAKSADCRYRIGYFYWETDSIPLSWADDIRKNVDELWVPCNLVKDACVKAGFRGPIEIVPTPLAHNADHLPVGVPSYASSDRILSEDTFKFYSIFQWNQRKGYETLLLSYFEEFSKNENVVLILKVNPIDHKFHGLSRIKKDITKAKRLTKRRASALPRVFLCTEYLDDEHINGLHRECDAFVLPHRGEGWGMPIHSAMMNESLVITTKYGGITEFLGEETALIIDHKIAPARKMSWTNLYSDTQNCAYPSGEHLKKLMRASFAGNRLFSDKVANAKCLAEDFSINNCIDTIESILGQKRFRRFVRETNK